MPRRLRVADGGYVYHVLNRAVARAALSEKDGDYAAFLRVLTEAAA
jgi:putative transposase